MGICTWDCGEVSFPRPQEAGCPESPPTSPGGRCTPQVKGERMWKVLRVSLPTGAVRSCSETLAGCPRPSLSTPQLRSLSPGFYRARPQRVAVGPAGQPASHRAGISDPACLTWEAKLIISSKFKGVTETGSPPARSLSLKKAECRAGGAGQAGPEHEPCPREAG